MKSVLPLFVFVDACGWEILKRNKFAHAVAPHRRRLRSVFGYSSACIPSILSGVWPSEHRNWCYFVYDPPRSPFRSLKPLQWLPHAITSRRIFRRWLSKFVKVQLKFRGYFDLYNIPFRHISLFDFTEKKNPLQPGGLNRGPNIFDFLQDQNITAHVSDPTRSEGQNLEALMSDITKEEIDFAFLYWPALDGLMHRVGNDSPEVGQKLRGYERWLDKLLLHAQQHYSEIRLYVFSDHGMANCDELLDLRAQIDALGLTFGRDYVVVYDSTMARFWFFSDDARRLVTQALARVPQGRIMPDAELRDLGAFFPDRYFGELIFLAHEGVLIVPSHMGERPLRGMHGYHPDAPHSYAALLSNRNDVPVGITAIPHIYQLMCRDAEIARRANRNGAATPKRETAPASRQPKLVPTP